MGLGLLSWLSFYMACRHRSHNSRISVACLPRPLAILISRLSVSTFNESQFYIYVPWLQALTFWSSFWQKNKLLSMTLLRGEAQLREQLSVEVLLLQAHTIWIKLGLHTAVFRSLLKRWELSLSLHLVSPSKLNVVVWSMTALSGMHEPKPPIIDDSSLHFPVGRVKQPACLMRGDFRKSSDGNPCHWQKNFPIGLLAINIL